MKALHVGPVPVVIWLEQELFSITVNIDVNVMLTQPIQEIQ